MNSKDETPGHAPRYATWWSACDSVILPQQSTILTEATNAQTACIDHSARHEDFTVDTRVRSMVTPALDPIA